MTGFTKRLCFATVALVALAAAAEVHAEAAPPAAQPPAARRAYNVPAGPLSQTSLALSDQARVQVVFEAGAVSGLRGAAVNGEMTFDQAMGQLLAGTGLTWRWLRDGVVTIEKPAGRSEAGAGRVLGPVRVEAAEGVYAGPPERGEGVAQLGGIRGGQDQEERGLRPVTAAVGAGSPMAIEDIPRAVSVLTQTQIQAQDIQDIGEAIRRLPGMSMIERTARTDAGQAAALASGQVFARGFAVTNFQIDGGAPRQLDIINNGLLNLNAYERVELVRGPNGVFAGVSSPGGSLNLVRKRPGVAPSLGVTVSVGSFDRYQVSVDAQTPSLFGTPIAFRGVVSYDDQRFAWENDHLKRATFYGMADAPLGDRARFELGGSYSITDEDGFYQGSYRYLDGPRLDGPFLYNYAPDWAYMKSRDGQIFGRFFVRMLENWNFDIGGTYSTTKRSSLDTAINGWVNILSTTKQANQICFQSTGACFPTSTGFYAQETYGYVPTENLGVDFRVTGKFDTFFLKHNVYIAGDVNEAIGTNTGGGGNVGNPAWPTIYSLEDFLNLHKLPAPTVKLTDIFSADDAWRLMPNSSSTMGLTISDSISFLDRVFLNVSARRFSQETSQSSVGLNAETLKIYGLWLGEEDEGDEKSAGQWRPTWSLNFKPFKTLTVYGSNSEGFQDQSQNQTIDGGRLGPMTYKNSEFGLKYGRQSWLLQMSGYRLVQDNVASAIPGSRGMCGPTPTSYCFFLSGDTIKSKGFDIEFSGRVLDQLDLQLSYNYSKTKTTSSNLPVNNQLPTQLGKFFVNWSPKFLPRWSFNGGAIYRARIFESGERTEYDPKTGAVVRSAPFEYEEPSHVIVDLGVNYVINSKLSLNLLVENITDREYYSTVSSYANHIGAPRTALLRLQWRPTGGPSALLVSPTTGMAPFGDPADWYGTVEFGGHRSSDLTATSTGKAPSGQPVTWTFKTQATPAWAAKIGYKLSGSWRTEAEVGWKMTDFASIGGSDIVPYGLCGVTDASNGVDTSSRCLKPQGEAAYWSFTANLLRDFGPETARLRPFVGAGLGLTRGSVDFSGRLDGVTDQVYRDWYFAQNGEAPGASWGSPYAPGEKAFGSAVKWGFAWQVMTGLSFRLTQRARIDATYKYTRHKLDVSMVNVANHPVSYGDSTILQGTGVPPLGSFAGSVSSQTLTIGLRWAFGAR